MTLYAKWLACTEGLAYTLINSDTEYSVKKGTADTAGSVIIPEYWAGKKVSVVGEYGFRDCTGLTSLTIPSGVTSIGNYIFSGCSSLMSLIEVHGYRHIAYITQPVGNNRGNKERYRAYVDTMAEYSLPSDPSLVIAGEKGLDDWLSGGQIPDVEAVVAHQDLAALKALQNLQSLGIQVPGNVA